MRSLRDPKRKPTHPGELLREDVLPALKMSQSELARAAAGIVINLESEGEMERIAALGGNLAKPLPQLVQHLPQAQVVVEQWCSRRRTHPKTDIQCFVL